MKVIEERVVDTVLESLDVKNLGAATIRQCYNAALALERISGEKFVHLEFGVPGIEACAVGIEAQKRALDSGVASVYPSVTGSPEFRDNSARFVRAFIGTAVPADGIYPTVGSMQGCYNLLLECTQMTPGKNVVVYLTPGFPSHYLQSKVLGIETRMLELYDCRGDKLVRKLESLFADGKVCAMVYSNPNNPSWVCLTEQELKAVGELCTRYDVIALEDLAYLCMDFRKDRSVPGEAPFQSTISRYTDNCAMMVSASKIFSYAGERIGFVALPEALRSREYPELRRRYGRGGFGDNFALTYLYVNTSSCSHSAQVALSEMMASAVEGRYDFVGTVREYGRRAGKAREIFARHHFFLVYDRDMGEHISNGFFFTIGYPGVGSNDLLRGLLRCGICAIPLTATLSARPGIRVCVSMLNSYEDFARLDERLALFRHNIGK